MGEFVESSLERLLPVFEQIQNVQLFDVKEVNKLIKQCRRYEYRLQKLEKSVDDFLLYSEYMRDTLTLLRVRRQRRQYFHKHKLIEKPLREKVASLLRRCAIRFPKKENFNLLIDFLKDNNMYRTLSKAYTKAMQLHPRDIELKCEAAEWELSANSSAENARAILQLAIRAYPDDYRLFVSFFKVELRFVDKILKRRQLLQEKAGKNKDKNTNQDEDETPQSSFDVEVEDAVLQLKVCEAIMRQGMNAVEEERRGKMLLEMWSDCSLFQHMPQAVELLKKLEEKLEGLNDEYARLMDIEKAKREKKDVYEAYDEAFQQTHTQKLLRLYLEFCAEKIKQDDLFASHKRNELLCILIDEGWATSQDVPFVDDALRQSEGDERKRLLEKVLQIDSTSVPSWTRYIECLIAEAADEKEILRTINKAIEAVPIESSFPLWELALDYAVKQGQSNNVDKLFSRIFDLGVHVDRFKSLRVKYLQALAEEGHMTRNDMRKNIKELQARRPNGIEFCRAVTDAESSASKGEDVKLVKSTWEVTISEQGREDSDLWIEYITYLMKKAPQEVADVHQRAMLALVGGHCDEFLEKWMFLQQKLAVG